MRRIVRDYITAAIDRAKPDLERYIARSLQCPAAFPLFFVEPLAAIQEIRALKITAPVSRRLSAEGEHHPSAALQRHEQAIGGSSVGRLDSFPAIMFAGNWWKFRLEFQASINNGNTRQDQRPSLLKR